MFNQFNLFRRKYTYEELLVQKLMADLRTLNNQNPFNFLAVQLQMVTGDTTKLYTYIFNGKQLFVDDERKVTGKDKDLDFRKYCFLFNGKPKSYLDLEKYEFLALNFEEFKAKFNEAVATKKLQYRI